MSNNLNKVLKNPLIVFGTGRSGTTLISEIIFRHPQLGYPSNYHEKFPEFPEIGLIKRLYVNSLYQYHGKKFQEGVNKVSRFNSLKFIPSEAWNMWRYLLAPEYDFSRGVFYNQQIDNSKRDFVLKYFSRLVLAEGANKLAFKITGPSRLSFLNSLFPDANFLHITRKPVPTIASFLKVPFWKTRGMNKLWWHFDLSEQEHEFVRENQSDPVWMTAFQVSKIVKITQMELDLLKPKHLKLSYESFVKSPAENIQAILDFVGLKSHDACFNYIKENPIVGQEMPDDYYFGNEDLDKIYSLF